MKKLLPEEGLILPIFRAGTEVEDRVQKNSRLHSCEPEEGSLNLWKL